MSLYGVKWGQVVSNASKQGQLTNMQVKITSGETKRSTANNNGLMRSYDNEQEENLFLEKALVITPLNSPEIVTTCHYLQNNKSILH